MLLTSTIMILRETIEAVLLISILTAVSRHLRRGLAWLPLALVLGVPFALLYAANMRAVSEWFGHFGQEVVNAALNAAIGLSVVVLTWLTTTARSGPADSAMGVETRKLATFYACAALAVGLDIVHEGAEVAVYLGGLLQHAGNLERVLLGSSIGAAIGISVGVLLYYAIMAPGYRATRWVLLLLLALVCGNMLSQSARLLTQADLLPAGPMVWNSSAWLSEDSIPGQLLYALAGYESTPFAAEAWAYLFGVAIVALAAFAGARRA